MIYGGVGKNPSTPQGCWTYLFPFLWPLQPHSCARPRSPSWYSLCRSGRVKMNVSGPDRGMYFLIPEFFQLILLIPLVLFILDFHKPLLHKLMRALPYFPLPLPLHPDVFIVRLPPGILMNVLWWRLPPAGYTDSLIVMILFSASNSAFLTRRSLWFPWWLVSVGSLWVTCTPSYIKNSLTSGVNLLKNVSAMSNRNPTSCGSASILKRKNV